jgi:uncharacterized protein YjbI with pentapeptide repeats
MVDSKAAAVRPRVMVPGASETMLLEDEVRTRIEDRRWGIVELIGPAGAGKSAALGHLAHIFGSDRRLHLADCPSGPASQLLVDLATDRLVVCTSFVFLEYLEGHQRWRLASWAQDEWIEYLLAVHHDQCASVMRRLQADPQRRSLGGVAGLWCVVLDRLAADETLGDLKSALRQELDAQLPADIRMLAGECSFAVLNRPAAVVWSGKRLLEVGELPPRTRALLRHEPVTLLLAAEYLIAQLRSATPGKVLRKRLSEGLVQEAAEHFRGDTSLSARLRKIVGSRKRDGHAMAASLLHAADAGWIPSKRRGLALEGAYLRDARWPGIRLKGVNLTRTDLTGADLSEARLNNVNALLVQLPGAILHGAQLRKFMGAHGNFADADLSFVRAESANFFCANLRNARLEGALMRQVQFSRADLRGANCRRADLAFADLQSIELADADFTGANLSYANLSSLNLQSAEFLGARFDNALMCDCNLEDMALPGANFEGAILHGAHLTTSRMPSGHFLAANLSETGLADIDWPGADLRNADLRGATFHMGSSRSGLVGSPLACEGSRTGFYTDEYHEQEFKSPEEIRKANLCGADLRGARIDDVDFYLVDLRGAQYTPDQKDCFRRCGAILEARV